MTSSAWLTRWACVWIRMECFRWPRKIISHDKLGEIVYAEGQTQAVDPGTQLYGIALHKEWDQMSVAHNTITADGLRQDPATEKLVAWKEGMTTLR
jgi:hypothetical protein